MDIRMLKVEKGKIGLNKYKLTLRCYHSLEKDTYTDDIMYLDDDGLHEWKVNRIPKHQLLELVSEEELDTSEYAWMEGIELKTSDRAKEIAEIAAYGSLEAYQAGLQETRDEYLLDLECRVSMMELGLNE